MVQPLGNLYIIAAPSGAGKSSLISALLGLTDSKRLNHPAQLSVSHTTRAPREGEQDGTHYHFIDIEAFEQLIKADAFYEHAKVFENYYGTSKAAISDKLQQGIDVFLDIDWQGARQIKAVNPEVVSIFVLPPSIEALRERLVGRGKDSDEVINLRMEQAVSEMSHYDEFDYLIVNDDFEQALTDLVSIVNSHALSMTKQKICHQSLLNSLIK
ncbi:guanylate kinase [Glaciecola sp. XM2]|jgi:guanylate kinase|uniref:guanylate kinase n=1 Tax=Glaciecola sp. XM2 TaxID=1914931 RepID=UPI001BDEF029|nr:guanylate kinase [Glaciecola sp. XM2]MBT1451814.1 guanylate kinase [Glaciecola sp. XM2]